VLRTALAVSLRRETQRIWFGFRPRSCYDEGMSTGTASFVFGPPANPVVRPVSRVSATQYLQMIEAGVWDNGEKVELIEGIIVPMPPSGPDHTNSTIRFVRLFAPVLDQVELSIQGTLIVSAENVFDPDLALLRIKPGGYRAQQPTAEDVLLVVESAASSLKRDQHVKLPLYATAKIPEYWIVDLKQQQLHIHRDPQGPVYREMHTHSSDELVSPLALPQLVLRVNSLFE